MSNLQVKGEVDVIGQAIQRHIAGVDRGQGPAAGHPKPLERGTRLLSCFRPTAQIRVPSDASQKSPGLAVTLHPFHP